MSEYKKALDHRKEDELVEELKDIRLLMESMHDPAVMDGIIDKLETDPVYRRRHIK